MGQSLLNLFDMQLDHWEILTDSEVLLPDEWNSLMKGRPLSSVDPQRLRASIVEGLTPTNRLVFWQALQQAPALPLRQEQLAEYEQLRARIGKNLQKLKFQQPIRKRCQQIVGEVVCKYGVRDREVGCSQKVYLIAAGLLCGALGDLSSPEVLEFLPNQLERVYAYVLQRHNLRQFFFSGNIGLIQETKAVK